MIFQLVLLSVARSIAGIRINEFVSNFDPSFDAETEMPAMQWRGFVRS